MANSVVCNLLQIGIQKQQIAENKTTFTIYYFNTPIVLILHFAPV